MSQLVRRYVARADLGKTGSCHLFRHTAAMLLLEAGMDVRQLQVLLNHERLDTTRSSAVSTPCSALWDFALQPRSSKPVSDRLACGEALPYHRLVAESGR